MDIGPTIYLIKTTRHTAKETFNSCQVHNKMKHYTRK
jgi:hypothetical protein